LILTKIIVIFAWNIITQAKDKSKTTELRAKDKKTKDKSHKIKLNAQSTELRAQRNSVKTQCNSVVKKDKRQKEEHRAQGTGQGGESMWVR
jgi:hypothetical protein